MNSLNVVEYEQEFIENLKSKSANGIPLHILALSYYLCRKNCHFVSIQLTRGLKNFTLVRANVICYEYQEEGNHSFIEIGEWVYDTTLGVKIRKEYYYRKYKPQIIWKCNQDNCFFNEDYNFVIEQGNTPVENERIHLELVFNLLEYLEKEKSTINGERLLKEIEIYRLKYPLNIDLPERIIHAFIDDMKKVCLEGVTFKNSKKHL